MTVQKLTEIHPNRKMKIQMMAHSSAVSPPAPRMVLKVDPPTAVVATTRPKNTVRRADRIRLNLPGPRPAAPASKGR